jgi:hypothetical protein
MIDTGGGGLSSSSSASARTGDIGGHSFGGVNIGSSSGGGQEVMIMAGIALAVVAAVAYFMKKG